MPKSNRSWTSEFQRGKDVIPPETLSSVVEIENLNVRSGKRSATSHKPTHKISDFQNDHINSINLIRAPKFDSCEWQSQASPKFQNDQFQGVSQKYPPFVSSSSSLITKDTGTEGIATGDDQGKRALQPFPFFYYRDFSQTIDDEPLVPLTPIDRSPNFVAKMHDILSTTSLSDIITWMPHGRAWQVLKPRAFESQVIPKYFEHKAFSSFIRQANGWGFRRITQGRDGNSYYHELFLRGLPHLCKKMKRPGVNKKVAADARHEPDLYAISDIYPLPKRTNADINLVLPTSLLGENTLNQLMKPTSMREMLNYNSANYCPQPSLELLGMIASRIGLGGEQAQRYIWNTNIAKQLIDALSSSQNYHSQDPMQALYEPTLSIPGQSHRNAPYGPPYLSILNQILNEKQQHQKQLLLQMQQQIQRQQEQKYQKHAAYRLSHPPRQNPYAAGFTTLNRSIRGQNSAQTSQVQETEEIDSVSQDTVLDKDEKLAGLQRTVAALKNAVNQEISFSNETKDTIQKTLKEDCVPSRNDTSQYAKGFAAALTLSKAHNIYAVKDVSANYAQPILPNNRQARTFEEASNCVGLGLDGSSGSEILCLRDADDGSDNANKLAHPH